MSYIIKVEWEGEVKDEVKYYGGMQLHQSMVGDMERWGEEFPFLTKRYLAKKYDVLEEAQNEADYLNGVYQDSKITTEQYEREKNTTDESE